MATHEEILATCIEKRHFDSTIVFRKPLLSQFFDHMKEEKYSGPFKKSMFVNHGTLLRKARELGIKIGKDRIKGYYFIDNEEFINIPDPVLFDPALIDIPKE